MYTQWIGDGLRMRRRLCHLGRELWSAKYIYVFLLPGLIYYGIFRYGPMYGLLMAFQDYNARLGVMGSPWVGLKHFQRMFITPNSISALVNTFVISFSRLLIEFPAPILLALLLNEMRGRRMKRIYQTLFTFPHFLSWVIVSSILKTMLGNNGVVNALIAFFGGERVNFLATPSLFRGILYITSIWKEAGWSAILYIAAIAGVYPEYYEAAIVDGASRLQRIWHVTLPGIRPTIAVLFILSVGNVMNGGFDQIFNMRNGAVGRVADILDTYVYDITFKATPNYSFSTAVGMFKSVVNLAMLLGANGVVKRLSGEGLLQ